MGEEIAFENGRISNFQGLVTLTLKTLDRVILHTIMHQSSTSTYIPNFNEIEVTGSQLGLGLSLNQVLSHIPAWYLVPSVFGSAEICLLYIAN